MARSTRLVGIVFPTKWNSSTITIANPRTDWCFTTEPDPGLAGRSIHYARGRVIDVSRAAAEELYNYMYSVHEQTEPFRSGLQGPYALEITDGSNPTPVDYSFMDNLSITGWVPASLAGLATALRLVPRPIWRKIDR